MKKQRDLAEEHHVEYEERHKKGDILNLFFEEYCEQNWFSRHLLWITQLRSLH